MDPISSPSSLPPVALRPVQALQADLKAVLAQGRIVAGEVLGTLDGRSVLVGIGPWRVQAESHVELDVGARFLARVEAHAGEIVLRLLDEGAGEESLLLRALRAAAGFERPAGERLGDLRAGLQAGSAGSGAAALLADLEHYAWKPGGAGAELRDLVLRSGAFLEAVLAGAAEPLEPAVLLARAARETAQRLVALLSTAGDSATPAGPSAPKELVRALEEALLALGRDGSAVAGSVASAVDDLVRKLQQGLRAESGRAWSDPTAPASLEAILRSLAELEHAGAVRRELAHFLGVLSGDPRALAALVRAGAKLERDLKARLLAIAGDPDAGAASKVAERALAGIEAEQLFHLAREECGQGRQLAIAVPDAGAWTTATLALQPEPDGHAGEEERPDEHRPRRLVLGLRLSRLGALRADVLVRPDDVALRLSVDGEESRSRIERAIKPLVAALEACGRSARIAVVVDPALAGVQPAATSDVHFLSERHLMDLAG